jgi:hypothetical protein
MFLLTAWDGLTEYLQSFSYNPLLLLPVCLSARAAGTTSILALEVDTVSALTHPASDPAGITQDEGKVGDIFGYYRPSANKGILANRHTTYYGTVGT